MNDARRGKQVLCDKALMVVVVRQRDRDSGTRTCPFVPRSLTPLIAFLSEQSTERNNKRKRSLILPLFKCRHGGRKQLSLFICQKGFEGCGPRASSWLSTHRSPSARGPSESC